MWPSQVTKIVSGGQAGVDRGGLDAAIALGLPHGGWCPRGRRAEDGPIAKKYELEATRSRDYRVRTRRNVVQSDGTLIFGCGPLSGGTKLTVDWARCCGRPWHRVDFAAIDAGDANQDAAARLAVWQWLVVESIAVLNIAGPRASRHEWIAERTQTFLCRLLSEGR